MSSRKGKMAEAPVNTGNFNTPYFDESDLVESAGVAEIEEQEDPKKTKSKKRKDKKGSKAVPIELPKKKKGNPKPVDNVLDLDTSDSEVHAAMERMKQNSNIQNQKSKSGQHLGPYTADQIKEIKQSKQKSEIQARLSFFLLNSDMLIYNQNNISKTFKKLLNTSRLISQRGSLKNTMKDGKAAGKIPLKRAHLGQDDLAAKNMQVEKKFQKKMGSLPIIHQSDMQFAEIFGDRKDKWKGGMKRQNDESISTAAPQDPFERIRKLPDKLVKKVEVKAGKPYFGTSTADIMEARYMRTHNAAAKAASHIYVCLQKDEQVYDREQMQMSKYMRSLYAPYQQKIFFDIKQDSSDPDEQEVDIESILHHLDQPYDTVTSVNYQESLKGAPLKLLTRRSDFLAMSTIQMSLNPVDNRDIANVKLGYMSKEQIREYVNERNVFKRMCLDLDSKQKNIREKDKEFRDNYFRSFIHRQNFKTNTMIKFKEKVMELNNNAKPPVKVDAEKRRAELIKWQQNKRAIENKQTQTFDMVNIVPLLEGRFHDMDENDEVKHKSDNKNLDADPLREEKKVKIVDEIPKGLRAEFGIPDPDKMDGFQPDFYNIKKYDMSMKKRSPMWSGQDVMPDKLDYMTSLEVISFINNIRVWPSGYHGYWKRFRSIMRIIVRSWFFDNFLTFAVLLNTITLSLNHYGISKEVEGLLDTFNDYFTWVFIVEMAFKVVAMGVPKYCGDVMNLLDGGVVIISIFEIIYTSMAAGNMDLKAFSTIRMFRTFRVFRIARLLRGLESMQTIIGVIARSYQSFIYITLLMTVFIFIFSLLGMQLFGGKFNYPDGLPRGNYDSFSIAAITVFQILTMENWIAVLFDSMRGDLNKFLVCIYYISWIFLGNFILLNLFLAILLDSFLEEEDEDDIDEAEKQELLRLKQERKKQKLKRKQKNIVIMGKNKNVNTD